MNYIYTLKKDCRDCYKCVRVCPVHAIGIRGGHASISKERCLGEGLCIGICPQGAIKVKSSVPAVKKFIEAGEKVVVSLSHSYRHVFGNEQTDTLPALLKKLGIAEVKETEEVMPFIVHEIRSLLESSDKPVILSFCPAIINQVTGYFPDLVPFLAPVVSPPVGHGRMLKELSKDENLRVVHVTPCIARKGEINDAAVKGDVDAVLTFAELESWLIESGLVDEPERRVEPTPECLRRPLGRILEIGMTEGAQKATVLGNDGVIIIGLRLVKDFLMNFGQEMSGIRIAELLSCAGGYQERTFLERADQLESALPPEGISLSRSFSVMTPERKMPSEVEIREILANIGIFSKKDELDCGACGFDTCVEKAIAVYQGMAETEMCMPFMRDRVAHHTSIMEHTPNAVVLTDRTGLVQYVNPSFRRIFHTGETRIIGKSFRDFINSNIFERVAEAGSPIAEKKILPNGVAYRAEVFPIEGENLFAGIFVDVTEEEQARIDITQLRNETLSKAQEVISRQMHTAQEIAGLLGETTAETKSLLLRLVELVREEEEA